MTDSAVVTSSFHTGASCTQPDNSSLVYCSAGVSNVETSSTESASVTTFPNVATSPVINSGSVERLELPFYRPRSHSAPSVLYQQVALQLRGISDDFNREYSRNNQADAGVQRPPQQGRHRRMSLPEVHRHEPQSPNWLHSYIQSFRQSANSPSRSHTSSISRVPEEDMDTDEDELDGET